MSVIPLSDFIRGRQDPLDLWKEKFPQVQIAKHPNQLGMPPKLVYLACPYSHKLPGIMDFRFRAVTMYAASLMQQGYIVFSPISHSHEMAKYIDAECSTSWEFWEEQDFAFLELSSKLIVLALPGWEGSRGVTAEIAKAVELDIPIEYHTLEGGDYFDDH